MARRTSGYDFHIPGDELEHHRIQLEQNLQDTDLSLHLSSTPDEQGYENDSVEYARHGSAPSFSGFASFEHRSRENFDAEGHSHMHGWSYHDDEGINPYGAETMSTVAHHASGVTLSAGLGGRGGRRDVSLSGAEYDPDRPLQDIIAGMDSKLSVVDAYSQSKSRQFGKTASFEPPIIDSPGDLDRSAISLVARLRSPVGSKHLPCDSDSERSQDISRPKLSDTLQRVAFSPRRPRNGQPRALHALPSDDYGPQKYPSQSPQRIASSSKKMLTPKSRKASAVTFDPDATPIRRTAVKSNSYQPEVHVQPPTPSSSGSKFTKMAQRLAKDVHEEQSLWQDEQAKANDSVSTVPKASRQSATKLRKHPLHNTFNRSEIELNMDSPSMKTAQKRLHLPDVTGLTSAVISPAKISLDRYSIRGSVGPKDIEVRLVTSLNALHSKLAHLETENSIARRRVRELEFELEECKKDVVKERTRVMENRESSEFYDRSAGPSHIRADIRKKSKEAEKTSRYLEVVEEKKALESLIGTLRAHLSRVTSDLSLQQQMLNDLRSLRESDVKKLSEKSQEILQLRTEVERLAGEIEVLRGVVEEGLQERRQFREHASQEELNDPTEQFPDKTDDEINIEVNSAEDENKLLDPVPNRPSPSRSILKNANLPSQPTQDISRTHSPSVRRFVNAEELDRISVELDERRSDLSSSSSAHSSPRRGDILATTHAHSDNGPEDQRSTDEPSVADPTNTHDVHQAPHVIDFERKVATPFPEIRPGHLERLFFSAPAHNAKTCTACHRRRPRSNRLSSVKPTSQKDSSGAALRNLADVPGDDDGFHESSDDEVQQSSAKAIPKNMANLMDLNQNDISPRDAYEAIFHQDKLPPQTVLARVLRELEDDFTHYKGIYCELADEYKTMDSATAATKRNVVAQHLRDVIEVMERKSNQIASLYDLLKFEDKPVPVPSD
ncbi:hypothetical protein BJ138DRAFT_1094012 [Hygrophoropsis aurantiaca]|uniref:Uncharacterized protein n=1 Tax=Hygrophoropsis aurantiaca TaxID=72124 RepID=A0ACB7ZZK3_9AGAM|nr:hypothetical protein BJ138DRAFT_1094012 [Hygrophoropsis aurantiaca]